MARKKSEPTKYIATTRRAEAGGVGFVEKGQGVALGEFLDPATIAHLVKNGFYVPDKIDPAVQAELDKLNDG